MFRRFSVPLTLMMLVPTIGLVACNDKEPSASSGGIALPEGINLRALPSGVTATARINELDREIPLVINGDEATGQFENLPSGSYTVEIKFSSTSSGVVLAQAEQGVIHGGDVKTLGFSKPSYNYPDDDGDNYTNLNEILASNNPVDSNDHPVPKRAFVTSASGYGDLSQWSEAGGASGLEAADNICQARANAANLGGEYRAWLSDHIDDAYCRVANLSGKRDSDSCNTGSSNFGPYIRTDGFPIALDSTRLTEDGEMFSPINIDEYGNDFGSAPLFTWTGSDYLGRYYQDSGSCYAWTSEDADHLGGYGFGNSISYQWTETWRVACGGAVAGHLYCFQVSEGDAVLPVHKQTDAKVAFLSSEKGNGNLSTWTSNDGKTGQEAGNAICRNLANDAGLDNSDSFTAWLTSSSLNAKDALQANGPWARPDGVLVAENKAALINDSLFTGISQTEQGEYIGKTAWTGSLSGGVCEGCDAVSNCDDWTSNLSSFVGLYGASSYVNHGWNQADWGLTCESEMHLYCFEGD